MKSFKKLLFLSLLLLLPTQLAYHFWPKWSFVYGLRIDLIAPAVYLSDILILLIIILNLRLFRPFLKYIFILVLFAIFNILFSTSIFESLYKWIKIFEFALFSYYTFKQNIFSSTKIINFIFYSTALISLIGILQFVNGKTLGGFFYWLGERSFSISTPGIALVNIFGRDYLRAYSIFSHPNSLAGYLIVVILLFLFNIKFNNKNYFIFGLLLVFTCLVLSFSLSAYLSLLTITLLYLLSRYFKLRRNIGTLIFIVLMLVSLILPVYSQSLKHNSFINNQSFSQRLDLSYVAGQMIGSHFLTGTGLGTFVLNSPNYRGKISYSWILQPVHNIFLLVFSETGILGLLIFIFYLHKLLKLNIYSNRTYFLLLPVIFTGMADHYWLTLQQNQLLLSLLIGLVIRYDMANAK